MQNKQLLKSFNEEKGNLSLNVLPISKDQTSKPISTSIEMTKPTMHPTIQNPMHLPPRKSRKRHSVEHQGILYALPTSSSITTKRRRWIKYESFIWSIFLLFTFWFVLDRFVMQSWPRNAFSINGKGAGGDYPISSNSYKVSTKKQWKSQCPINTTQICLKPGPITIQYYDIVARVSGRVSITALNLLYFTTMHTFIQYLSESWIGRNLINMDDAIEANHRIHKIIGVFLCILIIAHVWSILTPVIFSAYTVKVWLGTFAFPLSERTPPGFKDYDNIKKEMTLQGDDIWRIIQMSLILGPIMYLSVRMLSKARHIGIWIHNLIQVLFFIDIVRRHSHPHSWVLNTPFFLAFLFDKIVGIYWKKNIPDPVIRIQLSNNYYLFFWKQTQTCNTAGPKYYMRLKTAKCLESCHVFTGFENRCNIKVDTAGLKWTSALIVRIYHQQRSNTLGGLVDSRSHTEALSLQTLKLNVETWGPFFGGMSEEVRKSLVDTNEKICLIAGGSAIGYIIDALQLRCNLYEKKKKKVTPLIVCYSTNDIGLYKWVVKWISMLALKQNCFELSIYLSLTTSIASKDVCENVVLKEKSLLQATNNSNATRICLQVGRLDFDVCLVKRCRVYFQGSGGLQKQVGQSAYKNECSFVAGQSYDFSDVKKKDEDQETKEMETKETKKMAKKKKKDRQSLIFDDLVVNFEQCLKSKPIHVRQSLNFEPFVNFEDL